MRYRSFALALGLGLAVQACASKQTPVRLVADPTDASALVGEWNGEYDSPQNGRSGSIVFKLKAANDTAYGDIVMLPKRGVQAPVGGDPEAARGGVTPAPGQVLTIRFVRMQAGHIVGRLDPYSDPECGCRLTTVFTGDFRSPTVIEGTFESSGSTPMHPLTKGTWKVKRTSL